MFGRRLELGTVRGIAIRVDASWILIALLVLWTFWSRFGPLYGYGVVPAIALAVVATAVFFGSVLAHELAHSLEARHRGVEVGGITLFLFGGVTETRFDVQRPRDEFALTAIGPFTSLVLAAGLGVVATLAAGFGVVWLADVLGPLAWINLALAVFNLLPGAPLDGGRILRSIVWAITDDRGRAIRVAGRAGQVIGLSLAGLGLFQIFFVPGGVSGGIWWAVIGWFLSNAARSELEQQELQQRLRGRSVRRYVPELPQALPADAALHEARAAFIRTHGDVLPVQRDDEVVAALHVTQLGDHPGDTRIVDVATPLAQLPRVAADAELRDVLERTDEGDVLVVEEDGELWALTSRRELIRAVRRSLEIEQDPTGGRDRSERSVPHIPVERGTGDRTS